jgi:Spy/CpxP family protein refolding chaperone
MMKKWMFIFMGLLIAAAIATAALAFDSGRGPGYGPCGRGDFPGFDKLNLTADQKTRITEMKDAHCRETKPLQEKMIETRDNLRKLWLDVNPNQGMIIAAQKEMRSTRDQMQDKMTLFRLATLNVLTPEQKEKLKSFAEGRGSGPKRGCGDHRGFGPGGPCGSGGPDGNKCGPKGPGGCGPCGGGGCPNSGPASGGTNKP